ncbi:hypothetical protein HanIR_Chr12g0590311 [Helianthus annuus]|nr:hypothetical protein HanIR_Chr12g0590311 [Helianthus annuus]
MLFKKQMKEQGPNRTSAKSWSWARCPGGPRRPGPDIYAGREAHICSCIYFFSLFCLETTQILF